VTPAKLSQSPFSANEACFMLPWGAEMIARILQSTLCLCLSPLLVAQQVQQGSAPKTTTYPCETAPALRSLPALAAIPDNTKIKLGTVSTGTPGDSIRFAVVNDVVVDGVVRIPAGTWVDGVVSDTKRGSHRLDRDGQVTVRARDLRSGKAIGVRLAEERDNGSAGPQLTTPLIVGGLILTAVAILALIGGKS
jgi:hypothetical protein